MSSFINAAGIRFDCTPMSQEDSLFFLNLIIADANLRKSNVALEPIRDDEKGLAVKIVERRIEVMRLPISFSTTGLASIQLFARSAGHAVAILIDALNMFEGKEVTAEDFAQLYPDGFYTDDAFALYVEEYLKPRKIKWSDIY